MQHTPLHLLISATLQVQVTIGYCLVYIFMQTFAVPGTLSLSLLSGALYGALPGLLLVSGICCNPVSTCTHIPAYAVLSHQRSQLSTLTKL